MGRPALDETERENFRDRVTSVALQLVAREGFEAVTLRAIADEVGGSAAKLYTYFDGKEAILARSRARSFSAFSDFIEDRIEGIEDPERVLMVQGRSYLEFARRRPHVFELMFGMERASAGDFPEIRPPIRRAWNIVRGAVQRAVDTGVMAGDVDHLADLLWSAIHGIATLDLAGTPGPEWQPEKLADSMFRALIDAHRPDHSEPTEDVRDR